MENARNQVRTALLLAAGTGSRLQPLTDDLPKCLTEVNKTTILERLIRSLHVWEFERLVVVVGHLDGCVRDFLDSLASGLTIEYVCNEKYRTTNNIYSLWLASRAIEAPFLLLECDLVFDVTLLGKMLKPDRIAVSRILPWMNGTTVSLDRSCRVTRFYMGIDSPPPGELTYKTVNMYSFSQLSWQRVTRRLECRILAGHSSGYYEAVFSEMAADGCLLFEAVFFDDERWYEIDTLKDLHEAERRFPMNDMRPTPSAVGS